MWDILLASKQEAKKLAESILMAKTVRLQTEYMVHGEPADISKDQMGAFFAKYGQVDEVGAVISKSGIATGNIILSPDIVWARSPMC